MIAVHVYLVTPEDTAPSETRTFAILSYRFFIFCFWFRSYFVFVFFCGNNSNIMFWMTFSFSLFCTFSLMLRTFIGNTHTNIFHMSCRVGISGETSRDNRMVERKGNEHSYRLLYLGTEPLLLSEFECGWPGMCEPYSSAIRYSWLGFCAYGCLPLLLRRRRRRRRRRARPEASRSEEVATEVLGRAESSTWRRCGCAPFLTSWTIRTPCVGTDLLHQLLRQKFPIRIGYQD